MELIEFLEMKITLNENYFMGVPLIRLESGLIIPKYDLLVSTYSVILEVITRKLIITLIYKEPFPNIMSIKYIHMGSLNNDKQKVINSICPKGYSQRTFTKDYNLDRINSINMRF